MFVCVNNLNEQRPNLAQIQNQSKILFCLCLIKLFAQEELCQTALAAWQCLEFGPK